MGSWVSDWYNPNMELTGRQRAIMIGSLLGDACLELNGSHYRLRIEHGDNQKEYLLWKCAQFSGLVTKASPMKVVARHRKQNVIYTSWRVYTKTNSVFDEFARLFYQHGKKVVPQNIGDILTSPLSLAVWFMDDGYKRNDCNAFRISTESFSFEENVLLQAVLAKNFGIQTSIHRKGGYWNLYIPQRFSRGFVSLINSYVLPSLAYKLTLAP